jgi:NAD(P)-dependent dehydrogenase (short-subunit alcohol dehydrogenase family)
MKHEVRAMLTRFTGTLENKTAVAEVPLGRLGLPGKVAGGIVYIASNEAGFITAHILNRRRVQRQLTLAVGEGSRRAGLREPARCGRDRYVELRQD